MNDFALADGNDFGTAKFAKRLPMRRMFSPYDDPSRSESIRVDPSRSESIRVDPSRSESIRVDPSRSESIRVDPSPYPRPPSTTGSPTHNLPVLLNRYFLESEYICILGYLCHEVTSGETDRHIGRRSVSFRVYWTCMGEGRHVLG